MTPELIQKILEKPTDPYLQYIIDEIYRIWTPNDIIDCLANYRARHEQNG